MISSDVASVCSSAAEAFLVRRVFTLFWTRSISICQLWAISAKSISSSTGPSLGDFQGLHLLPLGHIVL